LASAYTGLVPAGLGRPSVVGALDDDQAVDREPSHRVAEQPLEPGSALPGPSRLSGVGSDASVIA